MCNTIEKKLWDIVNEMDVEGALITLPDEDVKKSFLGRAFVEGIDKETAEKFFEKYKEVILD